MKNDKNLPFLSPTNKKHKTPNKNISFFYSGAFYISLNRRYSTGGTTNIGETNRIYTYYQY